ncbi:MAG: dihydroorotase [Gammaproteobacteria bacterium]|nr:dihydroorotase [Gammaproteobacteria bacterium]MCW9088381.1 dihydroorotase [Gammaproteobacteria bacterium]
MQQLTLTRPDDWHLHLRDDAALKAVVGHSAERFARAIIMPNLKPPVTTTSQALAYRERILTALPEGSDFTPLMTLYLTDNTPPEEILRAHESGLVKAVKLYPAGATTNSTSGVTHIYKPEAALRTMAELGMPLLVHGEVTEASVDIFDREAEFLDTVLKPLLEHIPQLKVVAEHITTREMADFVLHAGDNVAATITPQHLLLNRNAMLVGGIRPHHYCLPVLKRESHREVLVEVATSGNPKFFLGTDSAPHAKGDKESACGCAGMYSAHAAIELYAELFEQAGALERLEGFASFHGADFYGLPRNHDTITLRKEEWKVPASYPFGEDVLVPYRAGEQVHWRLV